MDALAYVALEVQVFGRNFCLIVDDVHAKSNDVGFVLRAGGVRMMMPPATLAEATPAAAMVTVITPVSAVTAELANFPVTAKSAAAGFVAVPGYAPLVWPYSATVVF